MSEETCPHCRQLGTHETVKECVEALGAALARLQAITGA